MGDLISYLAHLGIVRVLTVPIAIVILVYITWLLAAPPGDQNSDTGGGEGT